MRTIVLAAMLCGCSAGALPGANNDPPPTEETTKAAPEDMERPCGGDGQTCCKAVCADGLTCTFGDNSCAADSVCRTHAGAYDYCVVSGACGSCS